MNRIHFLFAAASLAVSVYSSFCFGSSAPGNGPGRSGAKADRAVTVLAHEGLSSDAPGNTMPAFKAAKEAGADGIETDLRMTQDGRIVLCHDSAVDEVSSGSGLIADMTLDELEALDFGSWFDEDFAGEKLLTLDECLAAAADMDFQMVDLEIKPDMENGAGLIRRLADTVRQSPAADRVIVTSFDHDLLGRLRAYAPDIRVGILTVPNLSAISMFRLSDYFPEDKALADYTGEDVENVPDPVSVLMKAFGASGTSKEEILLGVIDGIAQVAPAGSSWNDADALIRAQKDPARYTASLDFKPDYLVCHYNSLTEQLVEAMRAGGIGIMAWTPDSRSDLEKALSFDIDGVITNNPEQALALIRADEGAPR